MVTVSGDNPSQDQQGQLTIRMAPGGRSGDKGRGGYARGYNKARGFSKFTKSNKQRGACEALGYNIQHWRCETSQQLCQNNGGCT